MSVWINTIWTKLHIEEGQGLVEYALILTLVAMVVIIALMIFGPQLGNIFSGVYEELQINP